MSGWWVVEKRWRCIVVADDAEGAAREAHDWEEAPGLVVRPATPEEVGEYTGLPPGDRWATEAEIRDHFGLW